jgi:hypothetical protein
MVNSFIIIIIIIINSVHYWINSYYTYYQLNAECRCVILQLKRHISGMLRSTIDLHLGDYTSINKYKGVHSVVY